MAVAKGSLSVTEGGAEENGVKNRLEKSGDGKLGLLHLGLARSVWRQSGGAAAV